jgi:tetratricopeptide (TPR) repeat protein
MNDPKINYNLFTIYILAGQFSTATDILHAGLKKGTIENTLQNWRILGGYYLQANKEFQAIDALKEAEKIYPKEGILDQQIGDIYHQLDKTKEAHDAYLRAVEKGSEDPQWKPWAAWQLVAYTSMELENWDEALRAIRKAAEYPEFAKDKQMVQFKKYLEDTVREREEAKKAKEEENKQKTPAEPKKTV